MISQQIGEYKERTHTQHIKQTHRTKQWMIEKAQKMVEATQRERILLVSRRMKVVRQHHMFKIAEEITGKLECHISHALQTYTHRNTVISHSRVPSHIHITHMHAYHMVSPTHLHTQESLCLFSTTTPYSRTHDTRHTYVIGHNRQATL